MKLIMKLLCILLLVNLSLSRRPHHKETRFEKSKRCCNTSHIFERLIQFNEPDCDELKPEKNDNEIEQKRWSVEMSYIRCVAEKNNLYVNDTFDYENILQFLPNIFEEAELRVIAEEAFDKCIKNIHELELWAESKKRYASSSSHRPLFGLVIHCVNKQIIEHCPASIWNPRQDQDCNEMLDRFKSIFF